MGERFCDGYDSKGYKKEGNAVKASRSIVKSRSEKILETVRNGGDVSVSSLSEMLQVSPLTIRRDLQYLEEHKLLEHIHFCITVCAECTF